MLTTPDHHLICHMPGKSFQDWLLHRLPRDQGEMDCHVVPWVLPSCTFWRQECSLLFSTLQVSLPVIVIIQRLSGVASKWHQPAPSFLLDVSHQDLCNSLCPVCCVFPDLIFCQGYNFLAPDFPLVSGASDSWRLTLLAKAAFSTSASSVSCVTRLPVSLSSGPIFSLFFYLLLMYLQKSFLLPLTSLQFQLGFGCPVSLHGSTIFVLFLGCLSLLPPSVCVLFATGFCQEQIVHPLMPPGCFFLDLLGWASEFGDDPWILISFLEPFFATGPYPMGLFQADCWRGQVCSPEVQRGH